MTMPNPTPAPPPPPVEALSYGVPPPESGIPGLPPTLGQTQLVGTTSQQQGTPDALIAATAVAHAQSGAPQPAHAVTQAAAQAVSQAISLGFERMPRTPGGWAALLDKYSSPTKVQEMQASLQNWEKVNSGTMGGAPTSSAGASAGIGGWPKGTPEWVQKALSTMSQRGELSGVPPQVLAAISYWTSLWGEQGLGINKTDHGGFFGQYANVPYDAAGGISFTRQELLTSSITSFKRQAKVAAATLAGYHQNLRTALDTYAGGPGEFTNYVLSSTGVTANKRYSAADRQLTISGATNTTSIIRIAQSQLGIPYIYGGEQAGRGFDCSGLVQWVYSQVGVTLPRVAQTQFNSTTRIPAGQAIRPGDLLFFGSGPYDVGHVGIYVGTGMMIDAPNTGSDVRYDLVFPGLKGKLSGVPTKDSSWGNFVGATRPSDPSGASTITPNASYSAPGTPKYNSASLEQYVIRQMQEYGL